MLSLDFLERAVRLFGVNLRITLSETEAMFIVTERTHVRPNSSSVWQIVSPINESICDGTVTELTILWDWTNPLAHRSPPETQLN
jgi:hypothetical protein